jgi:hypothetical protein
MLSYLVVAISLISHLAAFSELGVTYEFSGGRFGDCLLSYLHAKWIAYEKQIPLFYRPFAYSSQLVLHDKETNLSDLGDTPRLRFRMGNGPVNPRIPFPILYICPYFPEDPWELAQTKYNSAPWFYFAVNWKDPQFRYFVLPLIQPKKELSLVVPPLDRITIALHYREGGGYDDQSAHEGWPLKFPPLHFYVDALLSAIELCHSKPIYCHIFTDALHPELIAEAIQSAIPKETPILFGYRKEKNSPTQNVLEDFFSLFHFDILIRPQSNFSMIPSLLHDFVAVYSPASFIREGTKVIIEKTRLERGKEIP